MTPPAGGYLTLQGVGFSTKARHQINVLCSDDGPSITDGYAIWTPTARPLARGVTEFTGYNPMQMTCNVRFGRWDANGMDQSASAGTAVEDDIDWMDWMAGGGFTEGPSPAVYVNSYGSNLIPKKWQGPKVAWVINGGIQWGTAYRNGGGDRIYQEATFILLQYVGFQAAPKQTQRELGGYFTVTAKLNTAYKIASAPSSNSPMADRETLAKRIVDAPQNKKLRLRGIHQPIKLHAKVFVPAHVE